jgi:hypothetical protein
MNINRFSFKSEILIFSTGGMLLNNDKANFKHKKISLNISSILESLPSIKKSDLTPTEQKIYLHLSIEFSGLVNKAENYLVAANKWSQNLPGRLSGFGLTRDEWDRISTIGDNDEEIQNQVMKLIDRLRELRYF